MNSAQFCVESSSSNFQYTAVGLNWCGTEYKLQVAVQRISVDSVGHGNYHYSIIATDETYKPHKHFVYKNAQDSTNSYEQLN